MLALNEKWQHFEYSIRPHKLTTFLLIATLGVSFEWSARAGTCKNAPVILAHFNLSGPDNVSNIGEYAASPTVDYMPIFSGVGCRYSENNFRPIIC